MSLRENFVYRFICNRFVKEKNYGCSYNDFLVVKSGIAEENSNKDLCMPFELAAMQNEFNHYMALNGIKDSIVLSPTHSAIILHTEDMQALHRIEADTSIIIIPFTFGQRFVNSLSHVKSAQPSNKTKIYEPCDEIVNDYSVNSQSSISVLWPLSKPMPETYSYDFCYNAFVPSSCELMSLDNNTVISSWINSIESSRSSLPSRLSSYDNRLNEYIPLKNLPVFIFKYPYSATVFTDANGYFTIPSNVNESSAFLCCSLIDTDTGAFAVRDSVSNNAITKFLGTIGQTYHNSVPALFELPYSFETDIYQAAWYYYHGSNDELDVLPHYNLTGNPIDIYAIESGSAYGRFYYYTTVGSKLPRITIYNCGRDNSSQIFGTTLHELGHASHYAHINNPTTFLNITPFIKESFASFNGWFNVKIFYSSVAPIDNMVNNICSQGRQMWKNTNTSNIDYTPIFIDLYDSYNQYLSNTTLINDTISSVPVSTILDLALSSLHFNHLYGNMCNGQILGVYYTIPQFSDFIQQYFIFNNTKYHEID